MSFYHTIVYYGKKFNSYHIPTYAASASFFIITAIFPLLMLALSIVSLTPLSRQDFLDMIMVLLPESLAPMLSSVAAELMPFSATTLSISLVAILWTAAKSMLGLLDGLNAIADVNDTRNFIFKRILCMGYMLILILGLIVNLGLRVFGLHIQSLLEDHFPTMALIWGAIMAQRGLTLFGLITLVFMLIYTVFPNKKLKLLVQLPGAAFTSLAWMGFSALFSVYVNRVGGSSTVYGGLTTIILAMLWLYFCMYIVFIGAVINRVYPEFFWKCYVFLRRLQHARFNARQARKARKEASRDPAPPEPVSTEPVPTEPIIMGPVPENPPKS